MARCGGADGRGSPVIVRAMEIVGSRRRLWVVGTRGPLLRCWWVCVVCYCSSNGGGRLSVAGTRGLLWWCWWAVAVSSGG